MYIQDEKNKQKAKSRDKHLEDSSSLSSSAKSLSFPMLRKSSISLSGTESMFVSSKVMQEESISISKKVVVDMDPFKKSNRRMSRM